MISEGLIINGKKITSEDEISDFFAEDLFECHIGDYCLSVEFAADGSAFIGWLNGDEEVYYFDNGSGHKKPVDLLINVCPEERMMCYKLESIVDIVMYFCETGARDPMYDWIEEQF